MVNRIEAPGLGQPVSVFWDSGYVRYRRSDWCASWASSSTQRWSCALDLRCVGEGPPRERPNFFSKSQFEEPSMALLPELFEVAKAVTSEEPNVP